MVVVGRFRKPHGLKGDCTLFPLTDSPDTVFTPGREVWVVDLGGEPVAGPLTLERSRSYHREWLGKFSGVEHREALDPFRGQFLGVAPGVLGPLAGDEVFLLGLGGFSGWLVVV